MVGVSDGSCYTLLTLCGQFLATKGNVWSTLVAAASDSCSCSIVQDSKIVGNCPIHNFISPVVRFQFSVP